MRVFSVVGITQSGKTTTIENIIRELRKREYTVGSVKEIHFEDFTIDIEGTNTHRHKQAGSQLVTARGYYETDILFQEKLPINRILEFYDHDFVILEGVTDANVPKIITAHSEDEVLERLDDSVFAISGRISNEYDEFNKIPIINTMDNVESLVDLIEQKVKGGLLDLPKIKLQIDGKNIEMLPSKEKILSTTVLEILNNLDGYREGNEISIEIKFIV